MLRVLAVLLVYYALAMADSGDGDSDDQVDFFSLKKSAKEEDDTVVLGNTPKLFEGDIYLDPKQRNIVEQAIKTGKSLEEVGASTYGASSTAYKRWPNGVIYYTIDRSLTGHRGAMNSIYAGMKEWTDKTCIRFKRWTGQRNYVQFFRGTGCWAHIGMGNGRIQISVGHGCEYRHVMTHEIGHIVGFWHEQSRTDRDRYIQIYWQNISPALKGAFERYGSRKVNSLGVPYDYDSIMHYPWNAFSINGRNTIRPLGRVGIGPYKILSPKDVLQTERMYKCGKNPNTRPPPPSPPPVTPHPTGNPPVTQCKLVEVPGGGGGGKCIPNLRQCQIWTSRGECRKNPRYMLVNCACTCSGSCKDSNTKCAGWANKGECTKNPRYMLRYCKKSCNQCGTKKVKKCFTVAPPKTNLPSPPPPSPPLPSPPMPSPPVPTTKGKPTPPPASPPPVIKPKPNPNLPSDCANPVAVGLGSFKLADSSISASSSYNKWHGPSQARLHLKANQRNGIGSWCAKTQDTKQYLQIDLGEVSVIKKLSTQGRPSLYDKHVSKYYITFSDTGNAWTNYATPGNAWQTKEFTGNMDQVSVVTNSFFPPIVARYVRIHPLTWKGMICMRTELYKCEKDDGSGSGSGSGASDSFDDVVFQYLRN